MHSNVNILHSVNFTFRVRFRQMKSVMSARTFDQSDGWGWRSRHGHAYDSFEDAKQIVLALVLSARLMTTIYNNDDHVTVGKVLKMLKWFHIFCSPLTFWGKICFGKHGGWLLLYRCIDWVPPSATENGGKSDNKKM